MTDDLIDERWDMEVLVGSAAIDWYFYVSSCLNE